MIRALIGRAIQACIAEANRTRRGYPRTDQVDLRKMTDQEISDFIHGRPLDFAAIKRRPVPARTARHPHRDQVS